MKDDLPFKRGEFEDDGAAVLKVHAPTIKTIADLENFERGTVIREGGETDEEYARKRDIIMGTLQVVRKDLEDAKIGRIATGMESPA